MGASISSSPGPSGSFMHMGASVSSSAGPSGYRPSSSASVTGELTTMFKRRKTNRRESLPKKPRAASWSHSFLCLSSPSDSMVPGTKERSTLKIADLGEKKVSLFLDDDAKQFQKQIYDEFPKLKEGGGYELLTAGEGADSKSLVLIPMPSSKGYTTEYLKAVVSCAKIYIRPLQRPISTTPVSNDVSNFFGVILFIYLFIFAPKGCDVPVEQCLSCGNEYRLDEIKTHIQSCGGSVSVLFIFIFIAVHMAFQHAPYRTKTKLKVMIHFLNLTILK